MYRCALRATASPINTVQRPYEHWKTSAQEHMVAGPDGRRVSAWSTGCGPGRRCTAAARSASGIAGIQDLRHLHIPSFREAWNWCRRAEPEVRSGADYLKDSDRNTLLLIRYQGLIVGGKTTRRCPLGEAVSRRTQQGGTAPIPHLRSPCTWPPNWKRWRAAPTAKAARQGKAVKNLKPNGVERYGTCAGSCDKAPNRPDRLQPRPRLPNQCVRLLLRCSLLLCGFRLLCSEARPGICPFSSAPGARPR